LKTINRVQTTAAVPAAVEESLESWGLESGAITDAKLN
jgi:hypothetical protein